MKPIPHSFSLQPRSPPVALWEAAGLLGCLLLAGAFLAVRVAAAPFPSGDEGSWLSAAASLARGEGMTTRWLEYHWMEPYAVPRPDDMRYPVLTALLAIGMKVVGPSLLAMRGLIACVHLAFLAGVWQASRLRFGALPALLAAIAMALSPLQYEWSALVYCESLFGLVLALWLIWIQKVPSASKAHWIGSGLLLATLAMVRPNGVLLLPAAMIAALHAFRPGRRAWVPMALCLGAFLLALSPWLLRNAIQFGEPFHIGGSAGLLRDSHQESATQGLGEYLSRYGFLFPLKRLAVGLPHFFRDLHDFEKGLEILPILFVGLALLRRRPFLHPAAAWGFGFSFLACLYASYNSWSGLRYFSPFLPFVYAYGFHAALDLAGRLGPSPAFRARSAMVATGLLAAALLLTVLGAHRFWMRDFPKRKTVYEEGLGLYLEALQAHLPANRIYLGGRLCQVNYLGDGLCVGLQGPGREEWLPRALQAFQPELMALTGEELFSQDGQALMKELAAAGLTVEARFSNRTGGLFSLTPADSATTP